MLTANVAMLRRFVAWFAIVVAATILTSCGTGPDDEATTTSGDRYRLPDATTQAVTATTGPESTAVVVSEADPDIIIAARLRPVIVSEAEHATDAFTQGLLLHDGMFYESTGAGNSDTGPLSTTLRRVDPADGKVDQIVDIGREVFGEGLALVDDILIQLTWQDGIAFLYDVETFERVGEFQYDTQGWGLCYDGQRLVMSDGSSELTFRDPVTFAPLGKVEVLLNGIPITRINELECVNGRVWANVWLTDLILEIEPDTGAVVSVVDASSLLQPRPVNSQAVLNGLAWNEAGNSFFVTGKMWPVMYEVRFEADERPAPLDAVRPPTPIPSGPATSTDDATSDGVVADQ